MLELYEIHKFKGYKMTETYLLSIRRYTEILQYITRNIEDNELSNLVYNVAENIEDQCKELHRHILTESNRDKASRLFEEAMECK